MTDARPLTSAEDILDAARVELNALWNEYASDEDAHYRPAHCAAVAAAQDRIAALRSRIPSAAQPSPAAVEAWIDEKIRDMARDAQEATDKHWAAEWLMLRKPTVRAALRAALAPSAPAPTESAPAGLDAVREEVEALRVAADDLPDANEEAEVRVVAAETLDQVLAIIDRHRAAGSTPDAEATRLEVLVKRDGTWLRFRSATGKEALLCVENIAEGKVGIVGMALREWCADRRAAGAPAGEQVGEGR